MQAESWRAPLLRLPVSVALEIEQSVLAAIDEGTTPGAAVVIGDAQHVWYSASFGELERGAGARLVDRATIYDLSSLTKPLVTALALAQLVDQGRVEYEDPVAKHLPCFVRGAKSRVTVAQLLLHTAGLPPVISRREYGGKSREQALRAICQAKLDAKPGASFRYSDIGYVILGALVERISGQRLDRYFEARIAKPLGLQSTRFGPLPDELIEACVAPTEYTDKRSGERELICGETHDPVAWRLGGVAGNAGLFSTADDLRRFAQALLRGGALDDGTKLLSKAAFAAMTEPREVPGGRRNYGWDVETAYSKQRAEGFSDLAFGHSGFAGTSLWIDPKLNMFVLFLSNRVYPDGQGDVRPLQRRVAELALRGREGVLLEKDVGVMTGIDVLESQRFAPLAEKTVGLITNNAARTRDGVRTIDALVRGGVKLVRLFSPEHGLSAMREGKVKDDYDARTGTPVVSLFGEHKKPRTDAFSGLDVVLFDLQDVGVRFYTYQATLRRAMAAAAEQGVPLMVLDRPNPLGAERALGPMLDSHSQGTFINHHPLAFEHAMTLAELAQLFRAELNIEVELSYSRVASWQRGWGYSRTQLPWFAPSPNLPDVATVDLYPAVALIEGTDISVGRGTEEPFRLIGAPKFDAVAFVRSVEEAKIRGATLTPTRFVPRSGRHRGRRCHGARLTVARESLQDPRLLGYALVLALARTQPHVDPQRVEKMIGDREVTQLLLGASADRPANEVIAQAIAKSDQGLEAFNQKRKQHLLYP